MPGLSIALNWAARPFICRSRAAADGSAPVHRYSEPAAGIGWPSDPYWLVEGLK